MSATYSSSKRSQSVLSESDNTPKTSPKEYFSERGCLKAKRIRKSKFLSRKQVMFRYMEKVERINKKLRDMQRLKYRREILRHKYAQEQKAKFMDIYENLHKVNIENKDMYNDMSGCENSLKNLIQKFQDLSKAY